jgi:hypothetical protein
MSFQFNRRGFTMFIRAYDFSIPSRVLGEARRRVRRSISVPVDICAPAFGRFSGQLIDLSVDGCRLESIGNFAPGTALTLSIGGAGPVPATVVWSRGSDTGFRFGAVDHRPIVEQLLKVLGDDSSEQDEG